MYSISFEYNGKEIEFKNSKVYLLYNEFLDWIDKQGYVFQGTTHNDFMRKILSTEEVMNLDPKYKISSFHNINNTGRYILSSKCNAVEILDNIVRFLTNFKINMSTFNQSGFEDIESLRKTKLLNRIKTRIKKYDELDSIEQLEDESEDESEDELQDELEDELEDVSEETPDRVKLRSEFWSFFLTKINDYTTKYKNRTRGQDQWFSCPTGKRSIHYSCIITSRHISIELVIYREKEENKQIFDWLYSQKSKIEQEFGEEISWDRKDDKRVSVVCHKLIPINAYDKSNWSDVMNFFIKYFPKFEKTFDPYLEKIGPIFKFSDFKVDDVKVKPRVKNPFGCKDEDGEETSTLCIIGKSGSGKTTSTEIALEAMKHEYLLYIPIEGEYTFSQYTGKDFEMSSLGEFMMMAQNDPGKCYTIIFDECHRPITISKLNTDLLQALSSRRNRGGERFVTMDRSTKRMYTSSTDEFPITLKSVSGKVLVPDNFGIVCLSSNPSVICRNDDFLNRVDLVVFHESDRGITDLTELKKLEPSEKNIESIRGLLLSDGRQ